MAKRKKRLGLGRCFCSKPATASPRREGQPAAPQPVATQDAASAAGRANALEQAAWEWASAFQSAGGSCEGMTSPPKANLYSNTKYDLPQVAVSVSSGSLAGLEKQSDPEEVPAISTLSSMSSFGPITGSESTQGLGHEWPGATLGEAPGGRGMVLMFANPLALSLEATQDDQDALAKDESSSEGEGVTDEGSRSHEAAAAGGRVHPLVAATEAAAAGGGMQPKAEAQQAFLAAAAAGDRPRSMDLSPPSVSSVNGTMETDTVEVEESPICYLEHSVPLSQSHLRRFPSMGVDGVGVFARSSNSSHNSSPERSAASSVYSASPDTICSSNPSMLRTSYSHVYATNGIRQSWDFQSGSSPVRRPNNVPSLRLSSVMAQGMLSSALSEAMQEGGVEEAEETSDRHDAQRDLAAAQNLPLVRRGAPEAPEEEREGLFSDPDMAAENQGRDTLDKAEAIQRPMSPLGNAISRMNSGNYSPSSHGSGYNTPKAASPSPRAVTSRQSSPLPRQAAVADSNSLSLAAAAQSRQHSLMAQAMATGASPTRRRRRGKSTLQPENNVDENGVPVQQQQSPSQPGSPKDPESYARILGSRSATPGSADPRPGSHHRYHHIDLAGNVRDSLVEIGACDTPTIASCETPSLEQQRARQWAEEASMPAVVARALEARAAAARGEDAGAPLQEEAFEDAPSHVRAMSESFTMHNNSIYGPTGGALALPELDGEEEEEEEEDEDREEELAWEMDETTIVRAEGEDAGLEEGLEGPAVSEEPQVRGSRRALHMHQEPAGPGANPLRRSITQERGGSAAPKSRASTGPYSLYSNKAFQQEEQSSSETTDPLAGGSLSHARASQVLRSMSDIVSANKLQGPAPETMPSGQAFMHPTTAPELDSDGGSALVRAGAGLTDKLPQDITPLIKQAPAAVGLTPRTENLTPRGMDHGLMPRMTPRTRSTMDEMLQDKSLGSTFQMLVHGEERSREAAAGALYKMAQQECHKMAMCRVEGGIEALTEAMASLSTATGRQASAGALAALASHPGCRAVVADRGGVAAFVSLTASTRPEDQVLAARGLGYFATMDPKRSHILDAGGAYALVCLLEASESRVREAAARALWNLAHAGEDCRLAIADAGCIQVLLEMAKGDHPAEAAAAAGAIWNLAASVPNQAAIADAGGIPVMAGLFVEEGNPGAQLAAAGALCNLMLLPSNRAAILDSGTVPALAEALQCGAPSMKPTVARALYILARSPDGCGAIVDAGGCQPLIAEAANGNDMAAWALKGLLSDPEAQAAVLEAGGLQVLLSILSSPGSRSAGLEAAVWAVKAVTDVEVPAEAKEAGAGGRGGAEAVHAAGGLAALFSGMEARHATSSVREGAARACWNLAFQDEAARSELATPARLKEIVKLVNSGGEIPCRQAAAGVLWNLSTHSVTAPAVLAAGGAEALLKLVEDARPSEEASRLACKALCTLSVEEQGARVLVKAGAVQALSRQLSPGVISAVAPSNAVVVALYNCLMSRMRGIPPGIQGCPADIFGAVQSLVEAARHGAENQPGARPVILRALRGVVAVPLLSAALADAGAVEAIGSLIVASFAGELELEGAADAWCAHGASLDEEEVASAVWVLEGLAFQEVGQEALLEHRPLLRALKHLLSRGSRDVQRASVRIIHNLTVNLASEGDSLAAAAPGLLPALLNLAGDPEAAANIRESAAWSIKALSVQEAQRRDIVDLHGVKVICDLLLDPSSSHGSHQAAALALRNLATVPEHAAAIQAEGEGPIRQLVEILRAHEEQACCGAAASALANLSASEPLKMTILGCGGAEGLTAALRHPGAATRQAAARAVANLAYHCPEASDALVKANAIPALLSMLRSKDKATYVADVATAALAVSNMAAHRASRLALVTAGSVKYLLVALERLSMAEAAASQAMASQAPSAAPSAAPEESCVRALWGLAPEASAAEQMAAEGAVAVLLGLISGSSGAKGRRGVARACGGALRVLTGSEENRQAVVAGGALEQLVATLRSEPSPEAAEAAALACWDLAISRNNAAVMAQAGAIPALVGLLCSARPSTRHAAAGALHNIAFAERTKDAVVAAGGVEALIGLLTPQTPECCVIAANTLKILALSPANKAHIPQSGGLQALVGLMLDEGIAGGREAAAGALRNLATVKANKAAILEARALPCLIEMLEGSALEGRYAAAGALCNLAYNSGAAVKEAIVDAGVVEPLVRILDAEAHRHHRFPEQQKQPGAEERDAVGELAARSLWNLASGSDRNRQAIGAAGGVQALVKAAGCSHPKIRGIAAGALSHLAIDQGLKEAISDGGGVEVLAALLREGPSTEGFQAASSVLRNIAVLPSAKAAVMESGLVLDLVKVLEQTSPEAGHEEKEAAKGILRNLAFNSQPHAAKIHEMSGRALDDLLS